MKILHIITSLDTGGAELMLKRLIESSQNNSNYQHCVISLTKLGKVGEQLQNLDIEVCTLEASFSLMLPIKLAQLIKKIRLLHPDIVQTWMYHADLLGGLTAYLAGHRRIIWGIRCTDIHKYSIITLVIRTLCALLSTSIPNKIICVAEAARQNHIEKGYDASRMIVIQNGLSFSHLVSSTEQREILRLQCGFSSDAIVIGSLGRFDPIKDYPNFVCAAALIAEQHANVYFLMVGHNLTADNTLLQSWIDKTNHNDRFVLLGERSDVAVCLSAMDVFCLSSCSEGFPNALSEAMAMALPCVSTDVGDAALMLGDTGIVVAKENSEALASALSQIIELSEKQREEMGQRAKERVMAKFSIEKARMRFEAVYQELMKDKKETVSARM
ncbi:MAG: glycosyltransferase [Gammaproteobacteria bacterium]|nr:glycosyltransferase [Gammaproteobacteria bacterium]